MDELEVRSLLQAQLGALGAEHDQAVADLDTLRQADPGAASDDSAGNSFQRQEQLAIAASRRGMLSQLQHALERLDSGDYGNCESCGGPIEPARLQLIPIATLHGGCKARLA
jgi:RNA polymerase-binding transcription factor DksA